MDILQEKAVNAALRGDFKKAIEYNLAILKNNTRDIDAYLRLGFACMQRNDFKNSRKYYQKALKLQNAHPIAQANIEKINILEKRGRARKNDKTTPAFDPNLFLNVSGKTKVAPLINLGHISLLAKLKIGQRVYLKIKKRRVEVRNENNEYIGALPDDISKRLIFFIEEKSIYTCYIKEALKNQVHVFLKEEKKGKKVERYVSFPRNIQDDLKLMNTPGEEENNEIGLHLSDEDEDSETKAQVVDIEALAEEVDEKEEFAENAQFKEEKDDFEE